MSKRDIIFLQLIIEPSSGSFPTGCYLNPLIKGRWKESLKVSVASNLNMAPVAGPHSDDWFGGKELYPYVLRF